MTENQFEKKNRQLYQFSAHCGGSDGADRRWDAIFHCWGSSQRWHEGLPAGLSQTSLHSALNLMKFAISCSAALHQQHSKTPKQGLLRKPALARQLARLFLFELSWTLVK